MYPTIMIEAEGTKKPLYPSNLMSSTNKYCMVTENIDCKEKESDHSAGVNQILI